MISSASRAAAARIKGLRRPSLEHLEVDPHLELLGDRPQFPDTTRRDRPGVKFKPARGGECSGGADSLDMVAD